MMVSLRPQIIAGPAIGQNADRLPGPVQEFGFAALLDADDIPAGSERDAAPGLWGALVLSPVRPRPAVGDSDGDPETSVPQSDDGFRTCLPPQFSDTGDIRTAAADPDGMVASVPQNGPGQQTLNRDTAASPLTFLKADPLAQSPDQITGPKSKALATQSDGATPAVALIESDKPTGQFSAQARAITGYSRLADRAFSDEDQAPPGSVFIGSKEAAARLRAGADIAPDTLMLVPTEPESCPTGRFPVEINAPPASEPSQTAAQNPNPKNAASVQASRMLPSEHPKYLLEPPQNPASQPNDLPAVAVATQVGMWQPTIASPSASGALIPPVIPAAFPPDLPQVLVGHATKAAEAPIELLLNPEELGRLRFEMVQNGDQMKVVLSAERPETLDMLRKHVDQLLNEFKQAGFSSASLAFGQWGQGSPTPSKSPATQDRFEGANDIVEGSQESARHPHRSAGNSSALGLDLRL